MPVQIPRGTNQSQARGAQRPLYFRHRRWHRRLRGRVHDEKDGPIVQVVALKERIVAEASDRFEKRLTEECGTIRLEMAAMEARIVGDLKVEIRDMKAELMKWCFVFWIGQFFAVAGLVLAVGR